MHAAGADAACCCTRGDAATVCCNAGVPAAAFANSEEATLPKDGEPVENGENDYKGTVVPPQKYRNNFRLE